MMTSTCRQSVPLALLALLATATIAPAAERDARTFKLELKKIPEDTPRYLEYGKPPSEETLRAWCASQQVWAIEGARRSGEEGKTFEALAKKEPKYTSDFVIRGVVKLGKDYYPLACDSADMKKQGFDTLYFDANRNGDLTDDPVINAKKSNLKRTNVGSDSVPLRSFPRVDVRIRVGDTELDYAFFMSARAYQTYAGPIEGTPKKTWRGYAQFLPAVYREGEITLDGKKHTLCLLDFSSNGCFDDMTSLVDDEIARKEHRPAYAAGGDMLLVDPDPKAQTVGYGYGVTDRPERRYVSKVVWIDDRYWELKVTPSGETITLTPSERPTGAISNPAEQFHAVVYGEPGFLTIHGGKDKPVVLPEGEWRLLKYTIDLTKPKKPPATAPARPKPAKTLLGSLFRSVTDSGDSDRDVPGFTSVSAGAGWECKPVKVGKGTVTPMPFGPPYKPAVSVDYFQNKDTVNLQMKHHRLSR